MSDEQPMYSVGKTRATDEELAGVFAVLQARVSGEIWKASSDRPLAGGWKSYYRIVRQQSAPGRDAWRTSIRF